MLVGIEMSSALMERRSGVGNYTAHLAQSLQERHEARGESCFLFFSNQGNRRIPGNSITRATGAVYPYDRLPSRMLWLQAGLPRSIARTHPDLLHFPNHLAPLSGVDRTPFVITIHDMSVFRCPQYHTLKTVLMHRAIMPLAARRARLILTVSESARQEIVHFLRVPPDQVRVAYEGVGPDFRVAALPDEPTAADIRCRYTLPECYILTVCTLEPRKNHRRLIKAFAELVLQQRLPHHLVVVGPHGWKDQQLYQLVLRSGLRERIHFLGYVHPDDLPGIYRAASAFAFPSLYEGFGLPVLEAMASGVPALISHDPALREVAGQDNAVIVDPRSVPDIASGLFRIVGNAALAGQLRARGLARSAAFTWEECADQTYRLYCQVADRAETAPAASYGLSVGKHNRGLKSGGASPLLK